MAKRKKAVPIASTKTVEQMDRECQVIAMETALQQLKAGTAPPSLVNYFVKKADKNENWNVIAKQADAELKMAKKEQIEREKDERSSSKEAIDALRSYQPTDGL